MFAMLKSLFIARSAQPPTALVVAEPVRPSEKPWKRGTFAEDMEPLKGARAWNSTGTFCRYCGDWITDSAYYTEHRGWHSPLRGSWNYENPKNTRRDPGDIQPNHEEWLDDMRAWARKVEGHWLSCTASGIGTGARQFHSDEEARLVLEPHGLSLRWNEKSMRVGNGPWMGGWYISGDRIQ